MDPEFEFESSICDGNPEVIGGGDIRANNVMASEEVEDLTSSDASTDKVNSGDDEKVQQEQQSKEDKYRQDSNVAVDSTDLTSSKNTTGRATSRRGGGSRGGARRGGRGGRGKKQGTDSFYSFTSEFHASLFSPTKLNLPSGPFGLSNITNNRSGNEGDGSIPEKIFMTPELITQLSVSLFLFFVKWSMGYLFTNKFIRHQSVK